MLAVKGASALTYYVGGADVDGTCLCAAIAEGAGEQQAFGSGVDGTARGLFGEVTGKWPPHARRAAAALVLHRFADAALYATRCCVVDGC